MNVKRLTTRYENFFSYLVNLTLVILIVMVIQNFKSFDLEKSFIAFSYAFGGLLVLCTLIALPLDIITLRKDKIMCSEVGVDYESQFAELDKSSRKSLRKKYADWIGKSKKETKVDWLNFEE